MTDGPDTAHPERLVSAQDLEKEIGVIVERQLVENHVALALAKNLNSDVPAHRVSRLWGHLGALVSHPLMVALLGALAVWYLDGQATKRAEDALAQERLVAWQIQEREAIVKRENAALVTVANLVDVVFARATETGLLGAAIEDGDADTIQTRRLAYDAAYRDWNNRTNGLVAQLMTALGVPDATWETHNAATAVQTFIGWGQIKIGGICVDAALDAFQAGVSISPETAQKALAELRCKTRRVGGETEHWLSFLRETATASRACARALSIQLRVALRARADEQRRVLAGLTAIEAGWLDRRPALVRITEVSGLSECEFERS